MSSGFEQMFLGDKIATRVVAPVSQGLWLTQGALTWYLASPCSGRQVGFVGFVEFIGFVEFVEFVEFIECTESGDSWRYDRDKSGLLGLLGLLGL